MSDEAKPLPVWAQEWELSEEDAETLLRIINAPPGSPGKLTREPKRIPEGKPEDLR